MWSEHHFKSAPAGARSQHTQLRGCTGRAVLCQSPRGALLAGLEMQRGTSLRAFCLAKVFPS